MPAAQGGPDGQEERTAFYDEAFSGSEDSDDRDCDQDLLVIAEHRIESLCEAPL